MHRTKLFIVILALSLAILACSIMSVDDIPTVMPEETETEPTSPPEPTPTEFVEVIEEPEEPEPSAEPADEMPAANEPVQLTGKIELSNASILRIYYYERFVMLEDLTGFIQR